MIREVTTEEFRDLAKEGFVIADFFSASCGPCKILSFVLEELERTIEGELTILKIENEKNEGITKEYGVTGYPTLLFLKEGKEVARLNGLQPKATIVKEIEKNR